MSDLKDIELGESLKTPSNTNGVTGSEPHLVKGDITESLKQVTPSASAPASASANKYPINLSFKDVCYSISSKDKKTKTVTDKQILTNISGQAVSGSVVAIMGPTGSGKTSLLNILAKRCPITPNAKLTGSLLVNEKEVDDKMFYRLTSYVMQDDAMFAELSVFETLMIAAQFQLSKHMSFDEKKKYVMSIIQELGLIKCKDTIIGDARTRGVSGGERKRANIGVELIKNPSCLFLDEPTSGLDSFQAQSVMSCLRQLGTSGRTVVASIHQPRSSIFAMFDKLLLLSEGKCVFYGDASASIKYFTEQGHECPTTFNPADYFLDVVSPDFRTKELEVESMDRIKKLCKTWEGNGEAEVLEEAEGGGTEEQTESETKKETTYTPQEGASLMTTNTDVVADDNFGYQSSWLKQFSLCFKRTLLVTSRNKMAIGGKVFGSIFFGLVLGAIYSETSYDQKSIQDRVGVLFFFTINQTFSNMFGVLNSFTADKVVVERERAAKSYSASAFYLAKFCGEVPFNFIGPILFGTIVFWIVGLGQGDVLNFIVFVILLALIGFAAIALGLIIAVVSPTIEAATAFGPIAVVVMILFGGFYINIESLPSWLTWVQYLSLMRFAFEGLAVNELADVQFTCEDIIEGNPCTTDGQQVLDRLKFKNSVAAVCFWLVVYTCIEHFIAYALLVRNSRKYMNIEKKKVD